MRVFMLGWEFPPFISGGLGTACYGLTKALGKQDVEVIFVLPKAVNTEHSSHVRLLSPQIRRPRAAAAAGRATSAQAVSGAIETAQWMPLQEGEGFDFEHVTFKEIPTWLRSPYQAGQAKPGVPTDAVETDPRLRPISIMNGHHHHDQPAPANGSPTPGGASHHYEGDLITESQRYARFCVDISRSQQFDVIHAHDWLTFPAGLAVAAASGKPLVVHVHSTEFDRAGECIHQQVYDVERRGMHGAMRVICVSHLTASIVRHRYGIDPSRIDVVYNGIENGEGNTTVGRAQIKKGDKVVLFLGRITMQKGPEYFIRAARKVLEKMEHVKFVMAGAGDMAQTVIEMAAAEGIGHKVLFTGFLRGKDVETVFKMADVYVMPSVSEPFGIAPLEAISHDVPVIISKTSGVSEVLSHALKVDFWDIEDMANKIIAVLRHPPLSTTLREHADMEIRQLTWEGAAKKCVAVYEKARAGMPAADW